MVCKRVVPSIVAALVVILLSHACGTASEADAGARPPFTTGRLSFTVEVRGEVSPYRVLGVYVLPGESVRIRVAGDHPGAAFAASAESGELTSVSDRAWDWKAPGATGLCAVSVSRLDSEETMLLNAFVMVPFRDVKNGTLNGYSIGSYPSTPWKGLSLYKPPRGFVEVTAENESTPVSPHFTLGQFVCKQGEGYPKYLVLRERLPLKLEFILERVNAAGIRCDGFVIMSGYRTPSYNKAIGNVKYSRHVWGGAADIYIDENPPDGVMDDLNGDGRAGLEDAAVLYDIIDNLYGRPFYAAFLGGLGRYRETDNHGPFVHVDVRGFRARWGD